MTPPLFSQVKIQTNDGIREGSFIGIQHATKDGVLYGVELDDLSIEIIVLEEIIEIVDLLGSNNAK